MPEKKNPKAHIEPDKTVIKALALAGLDRGGSPCAVDVKDGKVIRVRPLHYDWKYDFKDVQSLEDPEERQDPRRLGSKSLPSPFSLAYKKRTYSPNRIKYPLKRVDWDPNGEEIPRTGARANTSEFPGMRPRISSPMKSRESIKNTAPMPSCCQGDGHGECKTIHAPHGQSDAAAGQDGRIYPAGQKPG